MMKRRIVTRAAVALAAIFTLSERTSATEYYFNSSASGAGNGSSLNPYSDLSAANSISFVPGDKLYLKGTFNAASGGIVLNSADSGTASNPVTITSWGDTRATINAGDSYGISAANVSGISISNLNVVGSGASSRDSNGNYANTSNGIRFYTDTEKQNYIRVNNVAVSGFGENGIYVQGGNGQAGFNDVKITNSSVYQNQRAGLAIDADFYGADRNAHSNVVIDNVKAYDNPGRATSASEGHSGNGIVIGQVNGGVIQNSVAWGNGTADASKQGGSVGIWAWDSNKIVIQHNESFKNGTAGEHDGGGFDLDGGVTNSVMQYNYSHDNAGAGYLLAEFKNARNFDGNIVRYNLSQDDARKNGYGAIHAFGDIDGSLVHDNTVYLSPSEKGLADTRDEAPAGIKLRGSQEKNIDFEDNHFILLTSDDSSDYQPTLFANRQDADGFSLSGNTEQWLDISGDEAAALDALLEKLGGDLSSGKIVAIDDGALAKYLKANEPVEAVDVVVIDPTDDVVAEILKPPVAQKPVADAPSEVQANVPEPSAVGLLAAGAVGLLRRRRRTV